MKKRFLVVQECIFNYRRRNVGQLYYGESNPRPNAMVEVDEENRAINAEDAKKWGLAKATVKRKKGGR